MKKRAMDLKVIGMSLSTLYAVSLAVCLFYFKVDPSQVIIFSVFLSLLLIGSIAVTQLKEWGRILIVVTSAVMGIYLLKPYVAFNNQISVGYALMSILIILFFSQRKVRERFGSVESNWRSILVVDDDETLLKTVRHILMSHGYSVLTATTGESGMQIANNQNPDLIILDVILPGIKGREVCTRLKANDATKDIPVVFLTAKDSSDDVKAEMEAGAVTHITKPVEPKTLITVVEDALEKTAK